MGVFIKYFSLIIFLSLIIAGFVACTNNGANKIEALPKGEYPPAPTNLMQATLTKTDGSTLKLVDYKGKILVVNVWATWCGPCRQEMPELIKLQTEHKNKGFEIIGLDVDDEETPAMIKDFAKEMSINYDLVKGDSKLFNEFYKISRRDAIPQSFLIDREGKLLGVFVGGGPSLQRLIDSVNKVVIE